MNVQITSVNMRYSDGQVSSVQVHYSGRDADRTVSINGYVPLTAEEYAGNEGLEALEGLVRQFVSEKVLEDEAEEEK